MFCKAQTMAFRRLLSSTVFASFRSSSSARLPRIAASTIPSTVFPNPKLNPAVTSNYVFSTLSAFISNPRAPPLLLPVSSRSFASASRTISVGDRLPDATLSYLDKHGNVQTVSISELTKGKKVIFLAVPGAFTPTCSQKHLPGFVEKADELRAKGVDLIACVSVNDAFVLKAWADSLGVGDKVLLLSDGNGHFTKALGVTVDLSDKPVGLGVRSRRYSLLAEDGVVKVLNLEEGGSFTISGADDILKAL